MGDRRREVARSPTSHIPGVRERTDGQDLLGDGGIAEERREMGELAPGQRAIENDLDAALQCLRCQPFDRAICGQRAVRRRWVADEQQPGVRALREISATIDLDDLATHERDHVGDVRRGSADNEY